MGSLRFSDLDLDALEVGGDLQWQEPSDNSNSADITEGWWQVWGWNDRKGWGGFFTANLKLNVHLHLAATVCYLPEN